MDEDTAAQLDTLVQNRGYANRSEAVRDMIRKISAEECWEATGNVMGVLITVFDHTKRQVHERITESYHQHHDVVITTMHFHLDPKHCMEISAIQGPGKSVKATAKDVLSRPGIFFGKLVPVVMPDS